MSDAALPGQGTSRRRLLVVCSTIGLLTAIMAASPLGAYLDRVGIDLLQPLRMVLHPPSLDPAQSPVAIVAIDEESYAALGNFPKVVWTPWLAAVIEALLAAKVKVIGLDIVFPTTLDTFVWQGKRPLEGIDIPFLQALNDGAADDRILLGYTIDLRPQYRPRSLAAGRRRGGRQSGAAESRARRRWGGAILSGELPRRRRQRGRPLPGLRSGKARRDHAAGSRSPGRFRLWPRPYPRLQPGRPAGLRQCP